MNGGVVRQAAGDPNPDRLARIARLAGLRRLVAPEVERAELDRSDVIEEALYPLLRGLARERGELDRVGQAFRVRNVRHRVLVFETFLLDLKGSGERENRFAALTRDHASRGEAAPVPDALDLEKDRFARVAAQNEINVERMQRPALHRTLRGDQRLRDHLAAEHSFPTVGRGMTDIAVRPEKLEIEERDEVVGGHGADSDLNGVVAVVHPSRQPPARLSGSSVRQNHVLTLCLAQLVREVEGGAK